MWQLSGAKAEWHSPPVAWRCQVGRPCIEEVRVHQDFLADTTAVLLKVNAPPVEQPQHSVDAYIRQDDLIATYLGPADPNRVRLQCYWRGLAAVPGGRLGGCELVISVQTDLLDADPSLTVESFLPAANVLRMEHADQPRFVALEPSSSPWSVEASPGVFLFRPRRQWSYLEMVYPSDFARAQIVAQSPPAWRLTSSLFPESLEKGVIRRGRIRGIFLPREEDETIALAAYREFVASPLPLTT